MEKKKILVVDDDPIIREVCKTNLDLDGFNVQTAENGEEAKKLIRKSIPDLMILDRMMPKLNGEKLLDYVRKHENTKNLPVVLLTAKGRKKDILEGLRLGANDYLIKPFSIQVLLKTITACLERNYLLNGGEGDWNNRSVDTKVTSEITFSKPSDIPGVLWQLSRDLIAPRIKGLKVGLYEALVNAVYHGNLEVGTEFNKPDNGHDPSYELEIEKRLKQSPFSNRTVSVKVIKNHQEVLFSVKDDGKGFDWKNLPNNENGNAGLAVSGRGILMIQFYYHNVYWNKKGNEINFSYIFNSNEN